MPTSPDRACATASSAQKAPLLEMEQRLGLARKFREYQEKLEQITSCAQEIAFEAQRYALNRKIEKNAEKIVELAQQIEE